MLIPRTYQEQTVNAAFKYMANAGSEPGNPLIAWPTGTGKAFGIALFIKRLFEKWPQMRVMMTAPSEELVEQNYAELKECWPAAPAGIYCSSLKRFDTAFPITFGTIDSIDGNVEKFGRIDILLPDECHRISSAENTRYARVYDHFKKKNKFFFMLGWTATDYRMGQGKLTDEGGLFTEVIYDATTLEAFNWFFAQAFLIPPIAAPTINQVSGEKMAMQGGDFKQSDLQKAFEADRAAGKIYRALAESVAVAQEEGRKSWICFVPGIEACEEVTDILLGMGIPTTFVHSKIKRAERRSRLKAYKRGQFTCMVNNGILTTGFNHKPLDFMIMLRKTASASLWVQMLGRGTRPDYAPGFDLSTFEGRWQAVRASGKLNFRVMDFVGNTARLGPINDPVKPKKPGEKKGSDAPIKICPADKQDASGRFGCGAYNHPSLKTCFYCDFEFPVESAIDDKASTMELVRESKKPDGPVIERFKVDKVTCKANVFGKAPNMLMTYFCGKHKFETYVCIQHTGYARRKAEEWWRSAMGVPGCDVPATLSEALQQVDELRTPSHVLVWMNTKPKEIKAYEY